jgi:hypothetical protein
MWRAHVLRFRVPVHHVPYTLLLVTVTTGFSTRTVPVRAPPECRMRIIVGPWGGKRLPQRACLECMHALTHTSPRVLPPVHHWYYY